MGAVLCVITKSVSYRPHRLSSCYGHMPEACSGCNPTVNKPKLSISSLDIIIKLKTTLTTSQTLKFNGALGTNKLDVWILPGDDVITRQHEQIFGFAVFDNF